MPGIQVTNDKIERNWEAVDIIQEGNDDGDHNWGVAIWDRPEKASPHEGGEPVCYLYENMGSHIARCLDDERNALILRAAPAMLNALQTLAGLFRDVAPKFGTEHVEAIAAAYDVIASTRTDEENQAMLDALQVQLEDGLN